MLLLLYEHILISRFSQATVPNSSCHGSISAGLDYAALDLDSLALSKVSEYRARRADTFPSHYIYLELACSLMSTYEICTRNP